LASGLIARWTGASIAKRSVREAYGSLRRPAIEKERETPTPTLQGLRTNG
jgi:hypothetical protein